MRQSCKMKKIVNAGIGGRSFVLDEDAYQKLESYLNAFRAGLTVVDAEEVMNDLEFRIAELFQSSLGSQMQVVNVAMVKSVISQLGMPDGASFDGGADAKAAEAPKVTKKLYRDTDNKAIAGVCSGLAAYFDVDLTLVRIIMLVLLLGASVGFWLYVIFWIAAPKAETAAQKCEMRGWPVTAENMAKVGKYAKK